MLVGADAPAGMGEDSLLVMRVDKPKSADGSSGAAERRADAIEPPPPPAEPERQPTLRWRRERLIPVRGGDQKSAYSRWTEERRSVRPPGAGEVEDASEMERQVRDQLYGPGFRRR